MFSCWIDPVWSTFYDLLTYIFAVATVPADASQTAVDHLDATEHQLQQPHGQQDGEQDDVPHHGVVRVLADCPQRLVCKVADITAKENSSQSVGIVQDRHSINENMCEAGQVWGAGRESGMTELRKNVSSKTVNGTNE